MQTHKYATRSRPKLQILATCKDHSPAASKVHPQVAAKLLSPSPENDCSFEPKEVAHLTDEAASYFINEANRLLRPKWVSHDHESGHEDVFVPLRQGKDAPVVRVRRRLVRMGLDRTDVPPGSEAPEEMDEIVVGGSKADQDGEGDSDTQADVEPEAPDEQNPVEDTPIAEVPAGEMDSSTTEPESIDSEPEPPGADTPDADIPMTEAQEMVVDDSTVDQVTNGDLRAVAQPERSIAEIHVVETPTADAPSVEEDGAEPHIADTPDSKTPDDEVPKTDAHGDFAASPATAVALTSPSPVTTIPSVVNPLSSPIKPATPRPRKSRQPLPLFKQLRPPRPPPPLFHQPAPRLPSPLPAPPATTVPISSPPREHDDITGYEHGDTPETWYMPFPGDNIRMRIYLWRRNENIKKANRAARPAWRN